MYKFEDNVNIKFSIGWHLCGIFLSQSAIVNVILNQEDFRLAGIQTTLALPLIISRQRLSACSFLEMQVSTAYGAKELPMPHIQEGWRVTSNSFMFGLCRRDSFPVTAPSCRARRALALSSAAAMKPGTMPFLPQCTLLKASWSIHVLSFVRYRTRVPCQDQLPRTLQVSGTYCSSQLKMSAWSLMNCTSWNSMNGK